MFPMIPPKLFCCQNPLFLREKNNHLEVKSLFEKAVAESTFINTSTRADALLNLYSLYMQATHGDINTAPPEDTLDNFEREKYMAWLSLKGKSIRDAQNEYIRLVHTLRN